MKHTLCWVDEQGNTTIDYRPVHLSVLTQRRQRRSRRRNAKY